MPAPLLPGTRLGRMVVPKVSVFLIYSEFQSCLFFLRRSDPEQVLTVPSAELGAQLLPLRRG